VDKYGIPIICFSAKLFQINCNSNLVIFFCNLFIVAILQDISVLIISRHTNQSEGGIDSLRQYTINILSAAIYFEPIFLKCQPTVLLYYFELTDHFWSFDMDSASRPNDVVVPPGWIAAFDPTYKCLYFHNPETGLSQWHAPVAEISVDQSLELQAGSVQRREIIKKKLSEMMQTEKVEMKNEILVTENPPDLETYVVNDKDTDKVSIKFDTRTEYADVSVAMSESVKEPLIGGNSQNYIHLAETYKNQRLYADPKADLQCVLCRRRLCSDVFFPCQHRCVCPECIVTQQVCEHQHINLLPHGFCNCPLCGTVIKKIIPSSGGREVEDYWKWAHEINPQLPDGFLRNFRHSAAVIEKVYMNKSEPSTTTSRSCVLS
jgi:hypothetical protein